MSENELFLTALCFTLLWGIVKLADKVASLEEDVELLTEGEDGRALVQAKITLAGRRVSRESAKGM